MRVAIGVLLLCAVAAAAGSFYELLQVSPKASSRDIKRAFRRMALKYHPDRNPSPDAQYEFIRLANAYEVLVNEQTRQQYDANPHAFRPPPPPPGKEEAPHAGPAPPAQQPPADFDYKAFFKKFDEMLKQHAEAHAKALGDVPGGSEHVAKHMRDHMKLHQQAQAAAAAHTEMHLRAHHPGYDQEEQHGKEKYYAPSLHINLEDLFEDMTEEEYEQMKKERGEEGEKAGGDQKCTTKTVKDADGKVTTVTECVSVEQS